MQCQVLFASDFCFEGHVVGVEVGSVFPEGCELLDGQVLLLSVLLVAEVLDDDVAEYPRHQHVELFEVSHYVLRIAFLLEQLPQILDDLLAVCMSTLLALFVHLVGVLQFIQNLLLKSHRICHDVFRELARLVPGIGNQSLNIHQGTAASDVRLVVVAKDIDENVDGVEADVGQVGLGALDEHVEPFRHLEVLVADVLVLQDLENDDVVASKCLQLELVSAHVILDHVRLAVLDEPLADLHIQVVEALNRFAKAIAILLPIQSMPLVQVLNDLEDLIDDIQ